MYYLSKGLAREGSTEMILNVSSGSNTFRLTGVEAALWLDGRYEIGRAALPDRVMALRHLERMGLVTAMEHYTAEELYDALCRCTLCVVEARGVKRPVSGRSMRILRWLIGAGLHLTTAELICLEKKSIQPSSKFLGEENRQTLTERIYDAVTIRDGELERQMRRARCRDSVTAAIMELIKTKRVVLL